MAFGFSSLYTNDKSFHQCLLAVLVSVFNYPMELLPTELTALAFLAIIEVGRLFTCKQQLCLNFSSAHCCWTNLSYINLHIFVGDKGNRLKRSRLLVVPFCSHVHMFSVTLKFLCLLVCWLLAGYWLSIGLVLLHSLANIRVSLLNYIVFFLFVCSHLSST